MSLLLTIITLMLVPLAVGVLLGMELAEIRAARKAEKERQVGKLYPDPLPEAKVSIEYLTLPCNRSVPPNYQAPANPLRRS